MRARTIVISSLLGVSLVIGSSCSGELNFQQGKSFSEVGLRDQQRALWVDHVVWLENHAISAIKGLEDHEEVFDRQLKSATDYGALFGQMYGDEAGRTMTRLLKRKINLEHQLMDVAKNSDLAAVNQARDRLMVNADRIASLYARVQKIEQDPNRDDQYDPNQPEEPLGATPPDPAMQVVQRDLVEHTVQLVLAICRNDWNANINQLDWGMDAAYEIADLASIGFKARFSDRVRIDRSLTAADMDLHVKMREVWVDHAMYTRFYVVQAVAKLDGKDEFGARLLQNQAEIGHVFKPIYSDPFGDRLTALLQEHIRLAAQAVDVMMLEEGLLRDEDVRDEDVRTGQLGEIKAALDKNTQEIVELFADSNPFYDDRELFELFDTHVELLLEQVEARINKDWLADIAAFDEGLKHLYELSDTLVDGIIAQRLDAEPGEGERPDEDQPPPSGGACSSTGTSTGASTGTHSCG